MVRLNLYQLKMKDRFKKIQKIYLDKNLNVNPYTPSKNKYNSFEITNKEKTKIKEMIIISERISSIFEFARIDLYLINNKIYFGEITLTPMACNVKINPPEYDLILGKNGINKIKYLPEFLLIIFLSLFILYFFKILYLQLDNPSFILLFEYLFF